MMLAKSTLRKIALQYRMLLDSLLHQQRNEKLCEALMNFLEEKEVKSLHGFLAIEKNHEPDISPLFQRMWKEDIRLIVSKTDFMFKQMRHYYLEEETLLVENKKGIPEPVDAEEASFLEAGVILVPLLVSDRAGYRIGYGGGYYDRLLAEIKAIKVGLSLSPPVDKIVQREEWDIPLDYLITPFKTYNYG